MRYLAVPFFLYFFAPMLGTALAVSVIDDFGVLLLNFNVIFMILVFASILPAFGLFCSTIYKIRNKIISKKEVTNQKSLNIKNLKALKYSFQLINKVFNKHPSLKIFFKQQVLIWRGVEFDNASYNSFYSMNRDIHSSSSSDDYWKSNDIYYSPEYSSLSCNIHNNDRY